MSIALSTSLSFFGSSLLARLIPMDSVLKSSILIVQRLALHQNGVDFHQQFNGAISTSISSPYDNVWRRMRLRLNVPFGDSQDIISFHCFIVTWVILLYASLLWIDRSYCTMIIVTRVILLVFENVIDTTAVLTFMPKFLFHSYSPWCWPLYRAV